ncbi:MAG: TIGR00295 family protein [Candidatus Thermoplasmatota archaeon]|nr:TIGR00295 family protein [Candidatus Thermoplasmatota archaeon]
MKGAGCPEDVLKHVSAVKEVALRMTAAAKRNGYSVDENIIEAGAILHDIGRSRTHGIDHAVAGAQIARELGLPQEIVSIIERHIGAGIPKEEAVKNGLPPKDYIPTTLEEKIVAHADNMVGRWAKEPIEIPIKKLRLKGLEDAARRMEELHKEMTKICGIDPDLI